MNALEAFLASGQAAVVVLSFVAVEAALLTLREWRKESSRAAPGAWISPLVAGAALVAALLCVQWRLSPYYLGLAVSIAGLAHLLGYRQRWSG